MSENLRFNGNSDATSSALLEQLVYIDNFMSNSSDGTGDITPNLDIDGQLSIDLAAFADDSFVFPDEEKPKNEPRSPKDDFSNHYFEEDNILNPLENRESHLRLENDIDSNTPSHSHSRPHPHPQPQAGPSSSLNNLNVSILPKFPVPPGAKSSLESAGLSQNQIDLLSALIAQHQSASAPPVPAENLPFNSSIRHNSIQGNDQLKHHLDSLQGSEIDYKFDATDTTSPASASYRTDSILSPSLEDIKHDSSNTSEVDKRRRNTAASARFRIKKKMKEKQMETKIHHLNDLMKNFESKISQLEMENKLLRSLIIEKGSQKSDNELKQLKERARRG